MVGRERRGGRQRRAGRAVTDTPVRPATLLGKPAMLLAASERRCLLGGPENRHISQRGVAQRRPCERNKREVTRPSIPIAASARGAARLRSALVFVTAARSHQPYITRETTGSENSSGAATVAQPSSIASSRHTRLGRTQSLDVHENRKGVINRIPVAP